MSRFILIDHSISSLAGHHYEYAMHVLEAAEAAGYTPLLVTNRKFRDEVKATWKVLPAYRYGFWAPQSASAWEQRVAQARSASASLLFRLKCSFRFSAAGVIWPVRDKFADYLLRQPFGKDYLLTVLPWVPLVVLFKIVRFFLRLVLLPLAVLVLGLRWTVRRLLTIPLVYRAAAMLFGDLVGLARFTRHLLSTRAQLGSWLQQYRCLRQFRRDTAEVFRQIGFAEGDEVFLPTISTIEMMGLRLFAEKRRDAAQASWHLLFRRDLYRGREADYPPQDAQVSGFSQIYTAFHRAVPRSYFYTDTDELTAQYNRLGAVPFHTVPIPHTRPPVAAGSRQGPLRVIYVGDARTEKGYQLLPDIVQDLWEDSITPGNLRFTLQSNYNIKHGEPAVVVARGRLDYFAAQPGRPVELLRTPLTSRQYQDLLLSGDINLLLYDRDNYYARSSGVLVESLAAGIPVIVPAGSWLARQFLPQIHAHQEGLAATKPVLCRIEAACLSWRRGSSSQHRKLLGAELMANQSEPVWTRFTRPAAARLALIRFDFGDGCTETDIHIEQTGPGGFSLGRETALVEACGPQRRGVHLARLHPAASRLKLSVSSLSPATSVVLRELTVEFLGGDDGPTSAVGLQYHHTRQVSGLLRELVAHYPHYRETACRFSEAWLGYHNAARLVDILARQEQGR